MEIAFHGAARTVTGSQHLITVNGRRILLDCGLYQGKRQETYERNLHLPFDAAQVDALVLSHAHIDHCGNIPNLVKSGFRGDIVCTYATRDLCSIMLRDSAKIQQYDVEYLNKKRSRQGQSLLQPIYRLEDAVASLKQFIGIGYERPYHLLPGITLTFLDAGHILGSAIVILDIEEESPAHEVSPRPVRLVFSGDLGRPHRPILRDPTFIEEADVLIMESTYGDREHPDEDETWRLEKIVNETFKRGGKIIVPAFAVGRTQELVYHLRELAAARDIPPNLRVYVDSPLAVDATGIYRLHPEAYDEETAEVLNERPGNDPFGFDMLRYVRTTQESKELNHLREPAIIISASGMAEAGRVLHHLKNNIEDPRNTIVIVGWQAPETLGRRLVEKQKQVHILGEEYERRAQVEVINGLSAHADRSELLKWAGQIKKRPHHAFLVHGEPDPAYALAEAMRSQLGFPDIRVPEMNEKVKL
jgi:metallo-beta-lactamase family protein